MNFIKTVFGFDPNRHQLRTEIMAGLTTFLTMCYILAVNPDILGNTGMDKPALFTATALASAIGTFLIAFFAKLPFAQAPGMGINAFFAFTLVTGMGYSWQSALAAVFVEGIVFILLTIFNIREQIVNCIPRNIRFAISVGIGMFIAFVGLKNAGIIIHNDATLVTLGNITPTTALAWLGILASGILLVLKIRGALFYSIMIVTLISLLTGVTHLPENFTPFSLPQSLSPSFFALDFKALLDPSMMITIFALVFIDIFNTIGTLIGAAAGTEMTDDKGNIKNVKQAMMADAVATSIGAVLGTSTVTTYVESGAGIAEGGRTGLTSFTTAILFLISLFFAPLFLLVPPSATAGALVLVGVFMLIPVKEIDMSDISEVLPAFITVIMMILTFNIAEGMALGLISYTLVKFVCGRGKEVSLTLYVITALLILRYLYEKSSFFTDITNLIRN